MGTRGLDSRRLDQRALGENVHYLLGRDMGCTGLLMLAQNYWLFRLFSYWKVKAEYVLILVLKLFYPKFL
jgi:hypothetical protein